MNILLSNRLKTLLTICLFAYGTGSAQNIAANPGFDDMVKCCEYKIYHAKGWFYIGAFGHGQKIDNKGFLKVICYNDTNKFYGIVLGSLVKPTDRNQALTLRVRLKSRKTFYLHHGFVEQHTYRDDSDTGAFTFIPFERTLVRNKRVIELQVKPGMDSCNYIALKFEDVLNLYAQFERVFIESIEVLDVTEQRKDLSQKYFRRIGEIYSNVQWHDFTKTCQHNRTLNR